MFVYYTTILFAILVILGSCENEEQTTLSQQVDEFFASFFNWRIRSLPQFATFVGIPDYNEYLDDLSEEGYQVRYEEAQQFLQKALEIEKNLVNETNIHLQSLKYEIQTFIHGFKYKGFYMPISNMEGPHTDVENLLGWMPKETYTDYETILTRMQKIPKQLDQMIILMKKGVENGITYHKVSMDGVAESFTKFTVTNPEASVLFSFFSQGYPDTISKDEIAELQNKAKQLIKTEISPAFEKLVEYISNEYVTRNSIAATSLPNGNDYYTQLIRYHTSTNMSAEEIQKIGFSQVTDIEEKMKKVVSEMGYDNLSVQEFSEMIRNDSSNFYNNSNDIMERFEEINFKIIPPRLEKMFKTIPKSELKIVANPSDDGPGAMYLAGSYDGSRAGVFYVNTHDLKTQSKYSMMSLSLHEGSPGHHLQGSYNIESEYVPFFRKILDDRNYGTNPSTLPIHSAYVEGWALYTEGLGFDMNLYEDPLDRYGHYSEEIFRACRLVVDTGIHALGWSREKAIEFMYKHTASPRGEIEKEINRYITWPGQALSYKIGQLKMRELRAAAEKALGDNFDIKTFHEIILSSVGPLSLAEEAVKSWIQVGKDPN